MKPHKERTIPNGYLFVDEQTNSFMLELESEVELENVCNFSWKLHANVENYLTEAKYMVVAGYILWNQQKLRFSVFDSC